MAESWSEGAEPSHTADWNSFEIHWFQVIENKGYEIGWAGFSTSVNSHIPIQKRSWMLGENIARDDGSLAPEGGDSEYTW